MPPHTRALPLHSVRVLDLTRVLAGPWCTMNLADLGAEVIKIEHPVAGDDTRAWGPPFLRDSQGRETSEAAYYLAMNRNKQSVAVDLGTAEGQALVRQLALRADVLVENFKVGGLAKYGLDAPTLRAANPRLIYCSITGFGHTGPYAARPGYDYIIQGMAGLMSITGERDDLPGGGPQKVGVAVTDILTGMYATVAILAALRERDGCADAPGSGMGQHLDMALLDSGVALLANLGMSYLVSGQPPGRAGNAHQNIVPYQVFAVRDGHIIVTAGNDGQFAALCRVLDCTALATDLRFATNAARVRHRETLLPLLTARIAAWEGAALLAALDSAGVPCGPINRLDQVFADPQVVARDLVRTLPHPLADSVRVMASPLRLSDTPVVYRCAPPLHGEHTDAVLRDILGRSAEEIADLRKRAVIGTPATASADRVRDGDINPP